MRLIPTCIIRSGRRQLSRNARETRCRAPEQVKTTAAGAFLIRRCAQPASEAFSEARAGCCAIEYSGLLLGLPSGVDPRQSQADRAFVANREAELLEALPGRLRLDQSPLIKQLGHRPLTPRGNEAHNCGARQLRVLGWLGIVGG